jgi:hypothetical protein
VEYFRPSGFCLDPCKGLGAFYDALPRPKDWCEITEGRDFLAYQPTQKVDWIITNPPWAAAEYRPIVRRCFELADDVVLLVRLHNGLETTARHADYLENGHRLKEIVVLPWDGSGFPPEGLTLAAMHWQRSWDGDCKWTYWSELAPEPAPTTTDPSTDNGCRLITGDSALKLKELAGDSIDLTVTSPAYDGLRTYGITRPEVLSQLPIHNRPRPANRVFNYWFDFETIAQELYRVTKPGGVVVWVVADQTRDYSESRYELPAGAFL